MSDDRMKYFAARITRLEYALSSIDVYLSDTLSGRVKGDPSTYKDWLLDGIKEARNRARAALIKPGDTVFHRPSGENWLVAAADPASDDLMYCGWPEGIARLSDCDLVKSCSAEESIGLHRRLDGARRSMADRVYGPPVGEGNG